MPAIERRVGLPRFRVARGGATATGRIRGIRGANEVAADTEQAILSATRDLLITLRRANGFTLDDVVSAVFTLTPDLHAVYPARAARELGWLDVPLLCASEIAVPGMPRGIVRVLLHVEMPEQRPPRHVYLGAARALRPDR